MVKNNRTKKQHYVPRFYLERFTDKNGLIWSYDFAKGSVLSSKPKDTGFEKNFYSPKTKNGEYIDDFEKSLAEVESAVAPLFGDLHAGKLFSGEDREVIALFLALQYLRSPMMISNIADANAQNFIKMAEMGGNIIPSDYEIDVSQKSGLSIIGTVPVFIKIFEKLNWVIVEIEGQHLITSDNPVIKTQYLATNNGHNGESFLNENIIVVFPLSPTRLLKMSWMDKEDGVVRVVDKQKGRVYNRHQACGSRRFLYANCNDSGIVSLGNKWIKEGIKPRFVSDEELPTINVKRTL